MALPPYTQLDPGQVIKQSYDESKRSIRVDAQISAPDGTSVLIDATTDSIKIGNTATGPFLNVNSDGSINVVGDSSANPSVGINEDPAPGSSTLIAGIDPSGNLAPVKIDSSGELVTNGTSTPAGLRTAGRVTTMAVTTSSIALPVSALSNRNALSVTNLSDQTLYVGFSNAVTADQTIGTNAGWEIGPNEGFNIDITNNIPIYGIVATGSIIIKVMELS